MATSKRLNFVYLDCIVQGGNEQDKLEGCCERRNAEWNGIWNNKKHEDDSWVKNFLVQAKITNLWYRKNYTPFERSFSKLSENH